MGLTIPPTVSIIKVIKCKSGPSEHAISIFKWPRRSVYIGYLLFYLMYLLYPFPGLLEVNLEGSSTFPTLILLIGIDKLGLFYQL